MVGRFVSVAQAAQLAHKSERAVRYQITAGRLSVQRGANGRMRIAVEALSGVPGWQVDESLLNRLDQFTARASAATEALDQRVRALERRVAALERRLVSSADVSLSAPATALPEQPEPLVERPERGPRTVTLADRGAGRPLAFANGAAAARWLVRHGVHSEYTPRSWPGWPPRPLTREAALAFAQSLLSEARARGDWRVTWRLHRCDDPLCVCQSMLEETEEED